MSTALGFDFYPLREELQKIGGMGHNFTATRVTSGSVAVSTGSYSTNNNNNITNNNPQVLSALEDSGNVNNRGLLQPSSVSSHHRGYSQGSVSERDSSTLLLAHTGGGGQASLHRVTSGNNSASVVKPQQQQSTQPHASVLSTSRKNESYDAETAEKVIEEKRKRASGDGFSIHRYTLGRLLGKGGFAKVYLCTAMDTGKNYAVKVVPKANLVKARARQKVRHHKWNLSFF